MTEDFRSAARWVLFDFLPARRRLQILLVILLMLVGGLAEFVTIGAVFPLLAALAGSSSTTGHGRMGSLLETVGLTPASMSLFWLGALFCAAAIAAAGIRILLAWASQKLAFRIGRDLGVALYRNMLYQPYSFHVMTNSSQIIAEATNIQRILAYSILPLMQALSAFVIGLFIFSGLLLVNAVVALVSCFGFLAIYAAVSGWAKPRLQRNAEQIQASSTARVLALQEGLGGIRDVLLDHSQPLHVEKFERVEAKLCDAQAANALVSVTPRFVVEALGMVLIVAIALVMAAQGSITSSLPVLAVLALGAQRLLPLLQTMYSGWTNLVGNQASFVSTVRLLRRPVQQRFESADPDQPIELKHELTATNLAFRYASKAQDVLKAINISIPRGTRIGLMGRSGSGKSTLADLLMGLLQPTGGSISVDGMPLTEENILAWQRQIAHVPQHIFLVDGSILENVAFGIPEHLIDFARVQDACREAELDEFIQELPEKYETFVGERGIRLSGGQRQRIGIARALYKRASFLILDEATSALDDATEQGVMQSIGRLGKDYTVMIIAHRLTTLHYCDTIYRLDRGKIVEKGNTAEVVGLHAQGRRRATKG